jgi:calcium-dependent protein kinase
VHRDLKLQNFMFANKDPTSPLKLIDFGLSKHFDESERMGRLVGTPYYIAPEVWDGHYTERCDHWSLGICAYMLMLGALPFLGGDLDSVRHAIRRREPAYRNDSFALSPTAKDFLQGLLRKNPADRPELVDCFCHPFMDASLASGSVETASVAAINLVKYLNLGDTKRVLLRTVALCLSSEQIAKLKQGFDDLDVDKNGVISIQELRYVCL